MAAGLALFALTLIINFARLGRRGPLALGRRERRLR